MRKLLIISLMFCSVLGVSQDKVLPDSVEGAFRQKYPVAKLEGWWEENQFFYLDFAVRGESFTAVFSPEGSWKETATTFSEMDIPQALGDFIRTTYPGGKISFCEEVETPDMKKSVRVTLIDAAKVFHVIWSDPQGGDIRHLAE